MRGESPSPAPPVSRIALDILLHCQTPSRLLAHIPVLDSSDLHHTETVVGIVRLAPSCLLSRGFFSPRLLIAPIRLLSALDNCTVVMDTLDTLGVTVLILAKYMWLRLF